MMKLHKIDFIVVLYRIYLIELYLDLYAVSLKMKWMVKIKKYCRRKTFLSLNTYYSFNIFSRVLHLIVLTS